MFNRETGKNNAHVEQRFITRCYGLKPSPEINALLLFKPKMWGNAINFNVNPES